MWNPPENPNAENEPAALRGLSKSKLYELVSREFFIPSKECRCVTRSYLVAVHEDLVWRVRHQQILQFEIPLSVDEKLKSPFFNIGVLKAKGNALLRLTGQHELGLPENDLNPSDPWFTRVIRYIDPWNILKAFKTRVQGIPPPNILPARMYTKFNH